MTGTVLGTVLREAKHITRMAWPLCIGNLTFITSVRTLPRGCLSTLSIYHRKLVSMALLYGRAGRLTVQNGDFRPG